MEKSIWQQLSESRETYVDGYGTTREVYEPQIITIGRKIKTGIDKFLNPGTGLTDEHGNEIKPIQGSGALEMFLDPSKVGKIDDVVKLSKNIQKVAKQYKKRSTFNLPDETVMALKDHGLTKMDASRLLERGWDWDQIFEALGRHSIKPFGKPNSNVRAKIFDAEMLEMGMKPNSVSRFDYLTDIVNSGKQIYKDKYGNPYTYEEWIKKFPGQNPSEFVMSHNELWNYYK